MIGYVTLGTNDIERAAQFYDQLLSELGAKRFMDTETFIAWVASPKGRRPVRHQALRRKRRDRGQRSDGCPANGFQRAGRRALPKSHRTWAPQDEGAPGPRGDGFYAGYFRDPDGNKLNAFCMG